MPLISKSRLDDPVSFPKTDDEWHSFLLPSQHSAGKHDRIEVLLDLQEYMDSLPKTSATFSLSTAIGNHRSSVVNEQMLHLLGTWKVNGSMAATHGTKCVNPNGAHSHHYSDMIVECGCGASVLRESFSENQKQPAQQQEHNDGCHKIHRHRTRLELLENRRETIIEMARLGRTYRQMSDRLGYKKSADVVPTLARDVGIDTDELQNEGRRRTIRTFIVLLREYSPTAIGRLYGVNKRTVSDAVRKESDVDPAALYSVRRRNGTTGGVVEA